MTFLERALPYAKMGIPCFPLKPGQKEPIAGFAKWPDLATTDLEQLAKWNEENPDYNCGLVAKSDGFLFLEFDIPKGMTEAAKEMKQDVARTRVHISGKGFAHHVFRQTDRSRALGNHSVNLPEFCSDPDCEKAARPHHHEWFSFRQDNRYVVGPGSIHPNGNEYGVGRDEDPIPCPDWICDFVERHATTFSTTTREQRQLVDDFDFDDWCEHYDIEIVRVDGNYHNPRVCPVAGYTHGSNGKPTITDTAFYYDGEHLGFQDFAQSCEGSNMSVGLLIQHLNQTHESYGQIFEDDDETLGVEIVEMEDVPAPELSPEELAKTLGATITTGAMGNKCACGADMTGRWSSICDDCFKKQNPTPAPSDEAEQPEAPARMAASEIDTDEVEFAKGKLKDHTYTLIAQRADSIKMEKLEWIWTDFIPAGKITLFAGKPDCGKSLATLNIIATVTTGRDWPNGAKNTAGPKEVALAATEDDLATTLVPRLKAAGADLSRVHLIKRVIVEGKKTTKRILQLKEDALLIKRMLRDHPEVALIVLDPLTGYFGEADPNRDKEIRPVMESIVAAVEKSKAAVVGIIHHNKRSDVDALGKILGGSAVAGVARAVWGFSRDTEEKGEFYMALVKGNLSKNRDGMKYKIGEVEVELADGTKAFVPHTEWIGATNLDANEVMDLGKNVNTESKTKVLQATEFLPVALKAGPRRAPELISEAQALGISVGALYRAKEQSGDTILIVKRGEKFSEAGKLSWWMIARTEPVMEENVI